MKKIIVVVVVLLVAGTGFIFYSQPELKAKLTNQFSDLIGGSDLKSVDSYKENFKENGLIIKEEKSGYVGGYEDSLKVTSFNDETGNSMTLGHEDGQVQVLKAIFDLDSGNVEKVAADEFKRIFDEPIDFSKSGKVSTEKGEAFWVVKNGKVALSINSKDVRKATPVEELPENQKLKLVEFEKLVSQKVKMENEWRILDDKRHFCFDQLEYNAITKRMAELKSDADKLKVNAKEIMKDLPMPHIMAVKEKLEGGVL
ncbi:MAG: hypothetical protein NE330_13620 [Lentisphaeraceae bacterium]|nr:hypothetical protein [Lentisphaeraceae bacterium]